jgi:hypothetical protein
MPFEITPNLDEYSPRIEQPEKINIPLKEHQKAIIYKARKLEELKPFSIGENKQMIIQFGVICDHVGAGKSYEILGTIASSPSLKQELNVCPLIPSVETNTSNIYKTSRKIDINIITVPHGVFKQWEDYISKHTTMKYYAINNFQSLKNLIKNYKIDELYEPHDPIYEPLIDSLLNNLPSHKSNKSEGYQYNPKITRDTKYYRYLDLYYNSYDNDNSNGNDNGNGNGDNFDKSDIKKIVKQYGELDINKLNGVEIVLISASLYNELAFYMIKDKYFVNRVIFDEADSINIPNNLKIDAIFYWFVSSSSTSLCNPDGVEKTINEQKSINSYGGPPHIYNVSKTIKEHGIKCNGFIKKTFQNVEGDPERSHYFLKNNDSFIEISFKLPEPIEHLLICRDNLQIKILNGIVSNDVMMMLNAGDTDGAINRLTCEKGSEDNIISVVTQRLEMKIIEFKEELKDKQTKDYITPKAKQEALERTQKKIQETRNKIKSIEERIKGVECCDICFDDINNPAVTGCCQNVFCFSCLAIAISDKNLCPKCRDSLTLDKIMLIKADKDTDKNGDKPTKKVEPTQKQVLEEFISNSLANDKYTNLEKIIEYKMKYFPKNKRKILIFSEHEGSFNAKLTGLLDKFNVVYSRIKGTSASINKTLREYRGQDLKSGDKEIDVLLINSRFFGAGLNLQNSSDIIILHRQGADILHQIIGRAQRIGRSESLNIWKLYHNNEAYNYVE